MSSTISTPTTDKTREKRLVLLSWMLVAFFYFYLSWGYVRVAMHDQQFADYLQYVVTVAGVEGRPNKEIRTLILVRSEQLGLPLKGDQITIQGAGPTLNVRVTYQADIEIPVLESVVYKKEFSHFAQFRPNR